MRVDVFTIFPSIVNNFCSESLLGKCRESGLLDLRNHDLREHTSDVHRTVDDAPFGGGAGMVMRAEPIFASVEAAQPPRPLFLLSPGVGVSIRPSLTNWPPRTKDPPVGSVCCAVATKESTIGYANTSSMAKSVSATWSYLGEKWRPASSSRP